jgi:regulator of protease activity HflC (stomatin/prohibitin superfamily)
VGLLAIGIVVAFYLFSSLKILSEYERAVIFRYGRLIPQPKGPGIIFVFSPGDRMIRVDVRMTMVQVPLDDVITSDHFTAKVSAIVFIRVTDSVRAVTEVTNYHLQIAQFAKTAIRSVVSEVPLRRLLDERGSVNVRLQKVLAQHAEPWGVGVVNVEIKEVELPPDMFQGGQLVLEGNLLPKINQKLDRVIQLLSES